MSFIDDPRKSRKLSRWLIRIVAICLVIYLALRYIDVIGDAALSVADLFSPLILGVILAMILNVALRPIERILFARTNNPPAEENEAAVGGSDIGSSRSRDFCFYRMFDCSRTDKRPLCYR